MLCNENGVTKAAVHYRTNLQYICLNALNEIRKLFCAVLNKYSRGVCAVFRKCFKITKAAVLINKGILVPLRWFILPYDANLRHKFHINLYPLAWILHLLIGLYLVFLGV